MRVTFGYLRIAPKPYDGSVSVTGGRVRKLELWRGIQQDSAGPGFLEAGRAPHGF